MTLDSVPLRTVLYISTHAVSTNATPFSLLREADLVAHEDAQHSFSQGQRERQPRNDSKWPPKPPDHASRLEE